MKPELGRPDMAGDDSHHGQGHDAFVLGKVAGDPNGQCAFAEIANEGEQETSFAEDAANIARAHTSTAQFANVLSKPTADKIVTGGKTAQQVGAKTNATGLIPVGRA